MLIEERHRVGGYATRALRRPARSAEAPLLLCLHGWHDSADAYKPLFAVLEHCDAELLALDMPDSGHADPLLPGPQLIQYVAFARAALEQFGASRRVMAVGQSLGGRALLMAVAEGAVADVRALVAVGPAPLELPNWQKLLIRNRSLMPSLSHLADESDEARLIDELVRSYQRTCFHHPERVPDSVFEDYRRYVTVERARNHIEDLRVFGVEIGMPMNLAGVSCPVELVWGAQDRIAPIAGASLYLDPLPQVRFTRLEDCGHHAHLERCDDVAAVILRALQEYP